MRRPLVAGNWKMNGTRASINALMDGVVTGAAGLAAVDVAVCPPFVYLPQVHAQLATSQVALGAQNVSQEKSGAFTGEIAADMLKDMGCAYVIVGHSERRALYGESDDLVARKYAAVQQSGMTPVLCVGELLEERERNETEAVIARQLDAVLNASGIASFAHAVIAYEPVWAIGTGKTATPQQAQDVHAFIRARLRKLDGKIADGVRILYGGSVKGSNAAEIFAMADVDGGLIGGASLKADEFITICRAAA
jgi:triosephosphate isomerase